MALPARLLSEHSSAVYRSLSAGDSSGKAALPMNAPNRLGSRSVRCGVSSAHASSHAGLGGTDSAPVLKE